MKQKNKKIYRGGQAMILSVILFLAFSLTAIFGVINPILRHAKATANIVQSKQGYFLAESGIEDIVYRLKNGKQVPSSNTLTLNGEMVDTQITDNLAGKTVVATGDSRNFIRKIEVNLISGVGATFNYGVQTGTGGFYISNNAGVDGNVYSNGSIEGENGSFITGSAISSNSTALSVDVENNLPATPPNEVDFGSTNGTQDLAQSFQVSQGGPIGQVSLFLKKVSSPSNITIRIVANNAGSPSNVELSSATLAASLVTNNFGWVDIPLQTSVDLVASTTYWLVLDTGTNINKYYTLAANNIYTNGQAKIGQYGGGWNDTVPADLDGYFKIYLGGLTGSINNVNIGTGGSGIAYAHEVNNVSVVDSLYCQNGSGNNKPCDTSQADPTPIPFPISQANITQWKNEALSGSLFVGNQLRNTGTSTLGPAKILGDLTLDNNHIMTITGTVWVTGDINILNGSQVKLIPSYGSGSGSIISDGRVTISNNSTFFGSGQSGSYIMVLTTSDCPNSAGCGGSVAIDVHNNAGAVILNAQEGTIQFSNNAGAKESTANLITLANNAVITYETGLTNVNFSSGPGGAFYILDWTEIE